MSDFLRLSPEITGQDQGRTSHSKADADELQRRLGNRQIQLLAIGGSIGKSANRNGCIME